MARPTLTRSGKFLALCRAMAMPRAHVRGHLEMLWDSAHECGCPLFAGAEEVEAAAEWEGEPGRFFDVLVERGWLDPVQTDANGAHLQSGRWMVHDYFDHAPRYVLQRADREAARQASGKTISDLRREAAYKRHGKTIPSKQTDANARRLDANGATPAPAPAPAPLSPTAAEAAKTDSEVDESVHCIQKRPGNGASKPEPESFDELWRSLPKRAGSNPRQRALRAAQARIREGATWETMIAGAHRYREFIDRTGKAGTEYVMQGATFLGPDHHYEQPWQPPEKPRTALEKLLQGERHASVVN